MGRGRRPHGLVPNARARRIAYGKRKNGLMKKAREFSVLCGVDKAREFSVLCGVDTCVVVFPEASAGGDHQTVPEVWPPDHGEARRIIERYRSAGSRYALADRKKKKKEKLDLGGAGDGELLGELSESQLRSVLSILGDGVDLAKRKLAAMKEEKRVAMAGAILGPCNEEGPSVDAVPQKTPHQACAASTPEWVAGAQPNNAHCSYSSVDGGWDTLAIEEDDSTFFRSFLTETTVF